MPVADSRGSPPAAPHRTAFDRGFAVPFTAPALLGVRVRPSPRGQVEFLLPNVDGSRGVRLQGWAALRGTHIPTLHDIRLVQYLDRLPVLSPPAIRAASHMVAAEGFLGEPAARLARSTESVERARLARRVLLLRRLAASAGESRWSASPCLAPLGTPGAVAWEAVGVNRIAGLTGLSQSSLALGVDELSRAFASVGGPEAPRARPARLIRLLDSCRADWREAAAGMSGANDTHPRSTWPAGAVDNSREAAMYGRLASLAEAALGAARHQLRLTESACDDVRGLLELWQGTPAAPAALVADLELSLDGWERVCLLWRDPPQPGALPAQAAAMLPDLIGLVALLPVCAGSGGPGEPPGPSSPAALRGASPGTAGVAERLARNERVRLAELALDLDDTAG